MKKKPRLLVIGNADSEAYSGYRKIRERFVSGGVDVVLYKQDTCLIDNGDRLLAEVVGEGQLQYRIRVDGGLYVSDDFAGVYWMHPMLPDDLRKFKPVKYREYINWQFRAVRMGLWLLMRDKVWINRNDKVGEADNKILQLKGAIDVGFKVPETLVTNDPDQAMTFYKKHGEVVTKSVSTTPVEGVGVFTDVVRSGDIDKFESIKFSPLIFQRRIAKKYELRITVVGEKVFPAKILPLNDEYLSIDWRRKPKNRNNKTMIEGTTIPLSLERKIVKYMELFGLNYGAFDFIVDEQGDYVFLEINPSGQWNFVEEQTGLKISEAIVAYFIDRFKKIR